MKDMYDYIMETPEPIREVIEKSKRNNEDCIQYVKNKAPLLQMGGNHSLIYCA